MYVHPFSATGLRTLPYRERLFFIGHQVDKPTVLFETVVVRLRMCAYASLSHAQCLCAEQLDYSMHIFLIRRVLAQSIFLVHGVT